MKYVLMYETADDGMAKAGLHFPAHRKRLDEFHARGSLLMVGPFADPAAGAMAIFTQRADAEEFAHEDPFVANGVVKRWVIREWNEIFT